MKLLRLAVEFERWDLAAHAIILATARILSIGEKPNVSKKRRPKGQPKS